VMRVLSKLQGYSLATISCSIALAVAWPIDAPGVMFPSRGRGEQPLRRLGARALIGGTLRLRLRALLPMEDAPASRRTGCLLAICGLSWSQPLLVTGLMEIKRRVEQSRNRAEDALRQAQSDLARVSRATTMGELTASLAHEVNQRSPPPLPIANTCLRWLTVITPIWKRRAKLRREL